MSSLLQSLRVACRFNVFACVRNGILDHHSDVPIQRLPRCNRLLALCDFEIYAVTSDATKRIFTNVLKLHKIRTFLRILKTELAISQ